MIAIKANFIEWNCPTCGKQNREACSTWVYGSPIRTCKFCHAEYLDRRWREVAIDGYDPRSMNSSLYLKGTIGFAVFALVMALWMMYSIKTRGYYHTRNAACVILGIFGSVMCLILFLRIKLGFEAKSQEKYRNESIARLWNPDYVQKLIDYGYHVPEEYLPHTQNENLQSWK